MHAWHSLPLERRSTTRTGSAVGAWMAYVVHTLTPPQTVSQPWEQR